MGQQMLVSIVQLPVHLPRVHIHAVLPVLTEVQMERDQIPDDGLCRVLGQPLLLHPVLVQGRHEVRQRSGHPELDLELPRGEYQGVLVSDGHQPEQPGGFHGAPLAAGAVRQRDHHRPQVLADDLELADGLELHGLSGEVLARGDGVGEDVQQQVSAGRGVHAEGHHVAHHRLHHEALERDGLVRVHVRVVELEVVVEDERGGHAGGHRDAHRGSARAVGAQHRSGLLVGEVQAVSETGNSVSKTIM